jgi:L-lactate dehydrogenase complex protein LldF
VSRGHPHDFPAAAREALGDEQLRGNLERATRTIRARRAAAVAELLDFEELREQARRLKDDALGRLDELLAQFEAAATAAGAHVHHAADAAAADAIVVDIARRNGVTELVKMKSLATDEILLDAALADAGVNAYETDLAELIVQLAGDTASHILVPAVHYSRGQIRDVFQRTIAGDRTLSDDPNELAEVSRVYLRERFLRAGMGVTGGNVAVAETGTVCVVENEGNGRMVTTLPPVLVSVVGIEKVVPSLDDLGLLLRLLPRSATGERMSSYVSLLTGVARGDGESPADGPQEYHIVLLDNGRRNALADPVGRQALRCIRCSACLNVCPVYTRVGGHAYGSIYPGPIGAILTPQLWGMEQHAKLPFASTLCGACAEVCPVGIDIPGVLLYLRGRAVREQAPAPEKALFGAAAWTFGTRRRFAAAQRAGRAAELPLERGGLVHRLPPPLSGWTEGRDLRPVARETFREWWARERADEAGPRVERAGERGEEAP